MSGSLIQYPKVKVPISQNLWFWTLLVIDYYFLAKNGLAQEACLSVSLTQF